MDDLRRLPSVDRLLQEAEAQSLIQEYGRLLTLDAIRQTLSQVRSDTLRRENKALPNRAELMEGVKSILKDWTRPSLVAVINASGVILHTNLGRAPLSAEAMKALQHVSEGYNTLEFDLDKGTRGSRSLHAEKILMHLTGAEAGMVVNNNAAALLLCLSALAKRRRVVISRSQLVEIGGGFRVPDVMSQSGAKLVEIGTTNRVNAEDYENALEEPAAAVLHVHSSNYKITGFTEDVGLGEIVRIAHQRNVLVFDDVGSGALLDTSAYGLAHEPTVQESLRSGVDLVCFSGDKLLGGPQAGIIVGKKVLIEKIKKHPLARAVRADKLCLAALSATLDHYLRDEAVTKIPIWHMIAMPINEIQEHAAQWCDRLQQGEIIAGHSTVGGGSLPGELLPTCLLALDVKQPDKFMALLRRQTPAIIARIDNDRVLFDPRTVLPGQEDALLRGLACVLGTIKDTIF